MQQPQVQTVRTISARRMLIGLLFTTIPALTGVGAQHHEPAAVVPQTTIPLLKGVGSVHFEVSTTHADAQRYFDQGLALMYAFNPRDARLSFQQAARLDSTLAMAQWGIALSYGTFINHPVITPGDLARADTAITRALALSSAPHERAMIQALGTRYRVSARPSRTIRDSAYRRAMAAVAARYPDDADVQTLYAESIMNLRPWKQWHRDGSPATGTTELVTVLERVLKRHPNHVGANHYYIHAVEGSRSPERAIPSAMRLEAVGFGRATVHMMHMPAHTWYQTGDYRRSIQSALHADSVAGHFPHNVSFLLAAQMMLTDSAAAQRAAEILAGEGAKRAVLADVFSGAPLLAFVRFGRWAELVDVPRPDSSMRYHQMLWIWSRGMAMAHLQRLPEAWEMLRVYRQSVQTYPGIDEMQGLNSARAEFRVAEQLLHATILLEGGRGTQAIVVLRRGVMAEDRLNFDEPPTWLFPMREALGVAYLKVGMVRAAEEAFREDLLSNRRSPRSLRGLSASLQRQGRSYEAGLVERELGPPQ